MEFNQTKQGGLIWKWDVFFGLNGKPYIADLIPYCPNHNDVPYKMT